MHRLITFFQVAWMLEGVYGTTLPQEFHDAFAWLQWITFDVFDVLPPECIGSYASRLAVTATVPLIVVALVMAISLGGGLLLKNKENGAAIGGSISVVIIWAMCPAVSKMIFSVYDCESYAVADDVFGTNATGSQNHLIDRAEQVFYMISDGRVKCDSAQHKELSILAGCMMAIWPIGMPLLLLALLCAAHSGSRKTLAQAMAPLSNEYGFGAYFWEVLEIIRRLILTAYVLSIPPDKSTIRVAVSQMTCVLYLALL